MHLWNAWYLNTVGCSVDLTETMEHCCQAFFGVIKQNERAKISLKHSATVTMTVKTRASEKTEKHECCSHNFAGTQIIDTLPVSLKKKRCLAIRGCVMSSSSAAEEASYTGSYELRAV